MELPRNMAERLVLHLNEGVLENLAIFAKLQGRDSEKQRMLAQLLLADLWEMYAPHDLSI